MNVNSPPDARQTHDRDPPSLVPRGEYGFDGSPLGALAMAVLGALLLVPAVAARASHPTVAALLLIGAVLLLSTAGIYVHTTRRGKFLVWARLLRRLDLRGDERVLDVGCGRGAVLTMIAKLLPRGHAVGIDLWSTADQSGNGPDAARRNIESEGVRDRCELVTGDMRSMPLDDASFDVVVSSIAIHNVLDREGRRRAIDEIARVLKPGGRVAIADLAWTRDYARRFADRGLSEVRRERLDWRFWWVPAVLATSLVTASKPDTRAGSGR
jgi:arsenite methyltransferase